MFIYAEPRNVSSGFEAFVFRRPALHQRLVEMTNNDVNAWGGFRPVVSQVNDTWDEQLNDFGNENYQIQNPFTGYFHDAGSQSRGVDLSKPAYQVAHQSQYSQFRRISPQVYQRPAPRMDFSEKTVSMSGTEYSSWNIGHGRSNFAELSGMQSVTTDFTYQPLMEQGMPSFSQIGTSSLLQPPYLEDDSLLGTDMSMDNTSPNTIYSDRSTSNRFIDSPSLGQYDVPPTQSLTRSWWPDNSRISGIRANDQEVLFPPDILPKYEMNPQPQLFSDPWIGQSTPCAWPSNGVVSSSSSLNGLSFNISRTSLSMSGSSQGSVLQFSDSSSSESGEEDQSNFSSPESLTVTEPQPRRTRRLLAISGSTSEAIVPMLPSNDTSSDKPIKKRPTNLTGKGGNESSYAKQITTHHTEIPKSSVHKHIEPKPSDRTSSGQSPSSDIPKQTQYRSAKDDFLVRSKLAGMSYKDIRKKGKFTEAESTLRGRFRTLTKHKNARVRKPEWNDNDIRLLKKAVHKITKNVDLTKCKVPWKQVADYISENGGSYHFGNATCRKRWDELQSKS